MIERQIGNSYPVDGESFAHGKATDFEVTYDYDDIYDELVEALIDDPYATVITLGTVPEKIEDFLGTDYSERIVEACNGLLDDDYGVEKHFNCIADIVTDLAKDGLEMVYEYTEMI